MALNVKRGRGALLSQEEREAARKTAGKLPWNKKGLSRVERVIAFVEWLPVTKGIQAGKKIKLLPDQREFIESVYGRARPDGRRQVKIAIKSEPKGNGKTGLAAPLCLCHLLGPEAEPRGAAYSAATSRDQAAIMYDEMEAILFAVPELAARVNCVRFTKVIEVLEGDGEGSKYEALSADARKAQGLAPSFWAYDELAQAKDRELLDNLMEGMGKRKEALGMIISTQAKDDDHPLSNLIDDALTGRDPSMYVQLHMVPMDADIFNEDVLKKANPAWGHFLDLDDLLASRDRARRIPTFEPAFRNLRCNQRVDASAEARLASAPVWKLGNTPVLRSEFHGRRCYAGLDLSAKHDLTALVLAFPDDDDQSYDLVPYFWTPEGQLASRPDRERDMFRSWIRQDYITSVPGKVIRYEYVAHQLGRLRKLYNLVCVGYDRWRIDDLRTDLSEEGVADLNLEPFGQGFRDMGPAVDYFMELVAEGRLRHGGHPVLTACVANAVLVTDPAGNQKPDKDKSSKRSTTRIDGAVAALIALGIARRYVQPPPSKVDLTPFLKSPVAA